MAVKISQRVTGPFTGARSHTKDGAHEATQVIDQVIRKGLRLGATSIHFEPRATNVVVRYRIDTALRESSPFSKHLLSDIAEQLRERCELPPRPGAIQEGRFSFGPKKDGLTITASFAPMLDGEKIVLQAISSSMPVVHLPMLGFWGPNYDLLLDVLSSPRGVLVIGSPPANGKSTTLLACIQQLAHPSVQITAIEENIRYRIPGVQQMQLDATSGLDAATAIRIANRQDSNIITLSDIKTRAELETAFSIADKRLICLALTTPEPSASQRYLESIVEPHLLTSLLLGATYQQLVPKLCKHCRIRTAVPKQVAAHCVTLGYDALKLRALCERYTEDTAQQIAHDSRKTPLAYARNHEGCESCSHTGVSGVTSINEISSPIGSGLPLYIDSLVKSAAGLIDVSVLAAVDPRTL